jgi:hemoglobin
MINMFKAAIACAAALALAAPSAFAQEAPMQSTPGSDSVYQGLGGINGIQKIVADFLPIVASDTRVQHQFDDVDMKHLAKMLAEQFCVLSGGPCKYTGKDMHTVHEDLGVTDAQFNAIAEDLQAAMDQQGIASRIQNQLIAKLAPMRRSIVTK